MDEVKSFVECDPTWASISSSVTPALDPLSSLPTTVSVECAEWMMAQPWTLDGTKWGRVRLRGSVCL